MKIVLIYKERGTLETFQAFCFIIVLSKIPLIEKKYLLAWLARKRFNRKKKKKQAKIGFLILFSLIFFWKITEKK